MLIEAKLFKWSSFLFYFRTENNLLKEIVQLKYQVNKYNQVAEQILAGF